MTIHELTLKLIEETAKGNAEKKVLFLVKDGSNTYLGKEEISIYENVCGDIIIKSEEVRG